MCDSRLRGNGASPLFTAIHDGTENADLLSEEESAGDPERQRARGRSTDRSP